MRRDRSRSYIFVFLLCLLPNGLPAKADGISIDLSNVFSGKKPLAGQGEKPKSPASPTVLPKSPTEAAAVDPTLIEQSLELLKLSLKCPLPVKEAGESDQWERELVAHDFTGTASRFRLLTKVKSRGVIAGETRASSHYTEQDHDWRTETLFSRLDSVRREGRKVILTCKNNHYCFLGFLREDRSCLLRCTLPNYKLYVTVTDEIEACDETAADSVQLSLNQLIAVAPPSRGRHFASVSDKVSIWNHNGSEVFLAGDEMRRILAYYKPRSDLANHNVHRATILFEGNTNGQEYHGKARVFSRSCGAIEYAVKGPASNRKIVLRGTRPVVDADCQIVGHRDDVLTFEYLRMDRPW